VVGGYMVELYLPGEHPHERVRAAANALEGAERVRRGGLGVRYLGSIFIPTDETCFHLFEADTLGAVREANERARVRFERIVAAVHLHPSDLRPRRIPELG
jgi:hypothetical protein